MPRGISIKSTLTVGTLQDVPDEVHDRIPVLRDDGGSIPCTAHSIQADTPIENIRALLDACRQIGPCSQQLTQRRRPTEREIWFRKHNPAPSFTPSPIPAATDEACASAHTARKAVAPRTRMTPHLGPAELTYIRWEESPRLTGAR